MALVRQLIDYASHSGAQKKGKIMSQAKIKTSGGANGGASIGERLARLEERVNHLATKAEIEKLKYLMILQTLGIFVILWRLFGS